MLHSPVECEKVAHKIWSLGNSLPISNLGDMVPAVQTNKQNLGHSLAPVAQTWNPSTPRTWGQQIIVPKSSRPAKEL